MKHVPILDTCAVLGVSGFPLVPGERVELSFTETAISLRSDRSIIELDYIEVADFSISGPGKVTTGGGFVGGGYGISGALEGAGLAAILNAVTARTKIHTILTLICHVGELHLHYGGMEPGALRIALAEVFAALRRLDPAWLATRDTVLSTSLQRGRLTEAEYPAMKTRLHAASAAQPSNPLPVAMPSVPEPLPVQSVPDEPPDDGSRSLCPNCDLELSLHAKMCPRCDALFTPGAAWSVRPL